MKDEEMNFSDIAELDESSRREAERVSPERTERITLRAKT